MTPTHQLINASLRALRAMRHVVNPSDSLREAADDLDIALGAISKKQHTPPISRWSRWKKWKRHAASQRSDFGRADRS